jgi:hypothetical protein
VGSQSVEQVWKYGGMEVWKYGSGDGNIIINYQLSIKN